MGIIHKHFQAYCYVKTYHWSALSSQRRYRAKLLAGRLKKVGQVTMGVSIFGLAVLSSPWWIAESIVQLQRMQRATNTLAQFNRPHFTPAPAVTLAPYVDPATLPFSINIPKIGVNSAVVPNVDATSEVAYTTALKKGVAHALGTGFPGQGKMIYIFGHSTDYVWNVEQFNALFYQVKDLVEGDEIELTLGPKTYTYVVKEKKVTKPTDVGLINDNLGNNVLILQTCFPPGTSWQRLLVVAAPINNGQ